MSQAPGIVERVASQAERVHVSIGAVCNNNCIFCMEEDRDGRYVNNSAMTPDRVSWILEQNRGAEEVCFTSGEPSKIMSNLVLIKAMSVLGVRAGDAIRAHGTQMTGHVLLRLPEPVLARLWQEEHFALHGSVGGGPVSRDLFEPG